jgi:phage protein D/phage baseplate assembly protein gpV
MPKPTELTSDVSIKLDGTEVDQAVMANLSALIVDQNSHLPDMFTIRLLDPELELLDNGPFDLTKKVEIAARTTEGKQVILIKGEITALEPEFGEGMIGELVVRGYDESHKMYRETKTRSFLNAKDSDLAEQIAKEAKLKSEIETTSTVYEHLFQHNQSDLAFLMQRAWRIGFECFVDDGKLWFRKPPTNGAKVKLTWGGDLLSFYPRMTLAEQVDEVLVKGWDVEKKAAIVGQAEKGALYPDIKMTKDKDGAGWAEPFGKGKLVIVDQPVISQAEANILATARLNELSGAFIDAEGTAFRRPDIKAGQMITLEAVGKRLSGTYLVMSATHTYTAASFTTSFAVRGTRNGLLLEQITRQPMLDQWVGIVPAIVTNTEDPRNWGRVKVKFPWLSDEVESAWARVVSPGAGPEAGLFMIPAVGDEVMVAFAYGDFNQPFVLGGVWNGQNKAVPEGVNAGQDEKPLVRSWHSSSGHRLVMYDDSKKKVEIVTAGGHRVVFDDSNKKVEIVTAGGHKAVLDDSGRKVWLESSGDLEVKAATNLKITANANINVEAGGQINIKGLMINLN